MGSAFWLSFSKKWNGIWWLLLALMSHDVNGQTPNRFICLMNVHVRLTNVIMIPYQKGTFEKKNTESWEKMLESLNGNLKFHLRFVFKHTGKI